MTRDMDLIRKILTSIEECSAPRGLDNNPEIEGYSGAQISYHINLLDNAGLIDANNVNQLGEHELYYDINLTWAGQDFVNASKNDTVWGKAKEKMAKYGSSIPFEILLETLKTLTKAEFERN